MELSELREISVKLAEQSRPSSSKQNVKYSQVPKTLERFSLVWNRRNGGIPSDLRMRESTALIRFGRGNDAETVFDGPA
jgi:hypothetical protein